MTVVWIGAGNLATRIALAMRAAGITILQVYSQTESHAATLAQQLDCAWTSDLTAVRSDADYYFFALKDTALPEVVARLSPNEGTWVHTAGSMPMTLFAGHAKQYGVCYPLQTFSKTRAVDVSKVPFFIEGSDAETEERLCALAGLLSVSVQRLSSEKRKSLHLAAVFACNFVNHLYVLGGELLEKEGIDTHFLLPLIDETAAKVHDMSPLAAQTGPAVRYDEHVIQKQLAQLEADPAKQAIYSLMSQSIHQHSKS